MAANTPERTSLDGVRVLVVEDHADSADLERELLEWDGATVHAAKSVNAALTLLDRHGFDVVVSDIAMPRRSGYDLVRALRGRSDAKRTIPMLAVSGHPSAIDGAHAIAEGFDLYLEKPIDTDTFLQAVRSLVPSRRGRRAA